MLINKTVLLASEAASVLNYSTQTIYKLIHTGKLEAFKEKGHKVWRIPEKSIEDYIHFCMANKEYRPL